MFRVVVLVVLDAVVVLVAVVPVTEAGVEA
jgi:hypothetical protein